MAHAKGGEFIADFLIREKIPYVFGVCGHGNVGLLDAMYDRRDELKLISPRHEQCAAHMADAYYRVSHQPVATLSSIGPGTANMVMALANAFLDSSAIFAISANVPTQQAHRGAFQEMSRTNQSDAPSLLQQCVKRSFQPQRVESLPLVMRQALSLATSGRPGPVNVDVPFNVFQETGEVEYEPSQRDVITSRVAASSQDVKTAVDLLLSARRPMVYAGNGVTLSEAGPELTELVEKLRIPVAFLPNGMGTLDMRDPLALGFVGRNGAYQANEAARHCDVLLNLGARFDDRSASSWIPGYSWNIPPTKLIQVDIDASELGRTYPVALGIPADIKTFLRQVLAELGRRSAPAADTLASWHVDIASWRKSWTAHIEQNFSGVTSPVHPRQIVETIRTLLPDDAVVLPDVGAHHNWFMQFWEARRPQTLLNAYGFGGMGFAVCGVLGAKLAAPRRTCVAVCGDGGFSMTPYVLSTAVEYEIPAVWVIWNNFGWTSIRDIQKGMFQGRELGTMFYQKERPYNPDFAAMARAYGVEGVTVTHGKDFKDAFAHAIQLGKPVVLDVHVNGDIAVPSTGAWQLPPTPHREPGYGRRYLPNG
ncbi:MAG: thiamine pyrophosphate-binding protein [Candidatus Binataceae bacterium]|nr:thiamine pyrophosphate-binding protein [Candidatus Binataceae bacterium]